MNHLLCRVSVVLAALPLIGCTSLLGPEDTDPDMSDVDAMVACGDWTPTHFDPCEVMATVGAIGESLVLDQPGPYQYNTDLATLIDPTGTEIPHTTWDRPQPGANATVIVTHGFTMAPNSALLVIGENTPSKPLIIASWNDIEIPQGARLAASHVRTGMAGGSGFFCTGAAGLGESSLLEDTDTGSGGGGGGGFGASGGSGGDSGVHPSANIYSGGDAGRAEPLEDNIVRGGCSGADGGRAESFAGPDAPGGVGGVGGGAIQLTARTTIRVAGTITAHGQGGAAGQVDFGANVNTGSGGGGGGSGGYIGFDAPRIDIAPSAAVTANGGGGGGGGGFEGDFVSLGFAGEDGQDSLEPAAGGMGGFEAGQGGDGGSRNTAATGGATAAAGHEDAGGGGGGGVGYIVVSGNILIEGNPVISPEHTIR